MKQIIAICSLLSLLGLQLHADEADYFGKIIEGQGVIKVSSSQNNWSQVKAYYIYEEHSAEYKIYNQQGLLVLSGSDCSESIDLSFLSNGIYFIRLVSDSRTYSGKIIVNR